jgi:hypothetical protein
MLATAIADVADALVVVPARLGEVLGVIEGLPERSVHEIK